MLSWINEELRSGASDGRKFILSSHIYPGAVYENSFIDNLYLNYTSEYLEIYMKYRESILLEVYGHDHVGDLRYNQGSFVNLSSKAMNSSMNFNFRNLLINPGATLNSFQNPGYGTFTIQSQIRNVTAKNLVWTFLPIEKTYNQNVMP